MIKIFYVDYYLSHSIKLFQSLLKITKNDEIDLKFLGPNKKLPDIGSSISNHVEKTWENGQYVRKLYSFFKLHKPDIVHFAFEPNTFGPLRSSIKFPILLFLTRMLKIKIIITLRSIGFFKSNSGWMFPDYIPYKIPISLLKILLKIFIKTICYFCDAIIVETSEIKLGLIEVYGINKEKIHLSLFIGVSANPKSFNSTKIKKFQDQFQEKKIIICFGFISPRKGQHNAVKALKIIHDKLPNHILVIAGKMINDIENYENNLHKMIEDFNLKESVFFTGYLDNDEVDILFNMADMALFIYNQMSASPTAVIHALEHETPCIVTKNSSFEEIFGKYGALYVKENDENELADSIYKLGSDLNLANQLKLEMKKLAQEFTWDKAAKNYLKVYKDIT